MRSEEADLETPILDRDFTAGQNNDTLDMLDPYDSQTSRSPESGNCGFLGAVSNISITAVGAGMLAMPKAWSTVGVALGITLTAVVGILTYISSAVVIRFSAKYRKQTYGALIISEFGRRGAIALHTAIIVHVLGVMIIYLIIIDDMLIGSAPEFNGLIPYILGNNKILPWWCSRWFSSLALVLGVVSPMLVSRDLSTVSRFSRFSVALLLSLAATLVVLAGIAVFKGMAADVFFLPDWQSVGGVGGPFGLLSAILTVLAVSSLAFTCQFNLVPIHNSMADNRTATMLQATRWALTLCALLYGCIAIAGYTLFGSKTDGDVLKNLTINFVVGIIGRRPAELLIAFVILANTLNLMINFVLKVWAVRDAGCELFLGTQARNLTTRSFYVITALLVAVAYSISVVFPSVWFLVSLVGSTACVTFSYIFPGLLLIKRARTVGGRVMGYGGVSLAGLMATVALVNSLTGNASL